VPQASHSVCGAQFDKPIAAFHCALEQLELNMLKMSLCCERVMCVDGVPWRETSCRLAARGCSSLSLSIFLPIRMQPKQKSRVGMRTGPSDLICLKRRGVSASIGAAGPKRAKNNLHTGWQRPRRSLPINSHHDHFFFFLRAVSCFRDHAGHIHLYSLGHHLSRLC
jgi:hypothetical protein